MEQLSDILEDLQSNPADWTEFYLISILKDCLGDEFSHHFEEVEEYSPDSGHLRRLQSYINVMFRHKGRERGFTEEYNAIAKEVSLAGILVDPALDRLLPGYTRSVSFSLVF